MNLRNQRELENTRVKLKLLEEEYARTSAAPLEPGHEKVRTWTLRSLKKLINQLTEEIARYQAHAGSAARA